MSVLLLICYAFFTSLFCICVKPLDKIYTIESIIPLSINDHMEFIILHCTGLLIDFLFQIVIISFAWTWNLAWFNVHVISLRLIFVLSLAGLCLFPSTLLLDSADTTQTPGLFLSFFLYSPPSTSTSEDLAVAVSEKKERSAKHTLLPVKLISF